MKVLVTGATGFIGHHVTRFCLEQGDEVRVLVLPGEDLTPIAGLPVEIYEGDLRFPESTFGALEGIEGVYHLAAIYALWHPQPEMIYKVNVEGTVRFLEEAKRRQVKKVIFTSSIAALGVLPGEEPATEETLFNQWRYANEYVFSKYISELEVFRLVSQGLPAVIVNPSFPFGPGDYGPTPTGRLLLGVLQGKAIGYMEGGFNIVHVHDVARGHLLAMEKGRIGEKYLLANKDGNISYRDYLKLVAQLSGVKVPDRKVPRRIYGFMARLMELTSYLTRKPPIVTYKSAMYGSQYLYYNPRKAIEELGLPQTPPEVALRDAIEWFREHGYQDGKLRRVWRKP